MYTSPETSDSEYATGAVEARVASWTRARAVAATANTPYTKTRIRPKPVRVDGRITERPRAAADAGTAPVRRAPPPAARPCRPAYARRPTRGTRRAAAPPSRAGSRRTPRR